jgi:hypothetical protein
MDEALPIYVVEGFVKVELKNEGWGLPAVATVKEVSGVCKTFRNAAPKNETGLVRTDKLGNERL